WGKRGKQIIIALSKNASRVPAKVRRRKNQRRTSYEPGKGSQERALGSTGDRKVPNSPNARCRKCGVEYVVVYPVHEADSKLAAQHAAFLSGYLEGEHVDDKHNSHLDTYEPLDWTDA